MVWTCSDWGKILITHEMRTTGQGSTAKRSGDTAFQHGDGSAVRGGYGTSSSVDLARGSLSGSDVARLPDDNDRQPDNSDRDNSDRDRTAQAAWRIYTLQTSAYRLGCENRTRT